MASADLGNLGPRDGPPVEFDWRFQWILLLPYASWLILAALLLARRENRTWRICWLIVPVALFLAGCEILPPLFGASGRYRFVLMSFLGAPVCGLACVWGWGNWIASRSRFLTFAKAALWMLPVSILCALCLAGFETKEEATIGLVLVVHNSLAVLGALSLAGIFCGGRYKPRRFSLWLPVCMVLCTPILLVIAIGNSVQVGSPDLFSLARDILKGAVGGAIGALALWVVTLPFLVLAFSSSFYRERFCAVCHLTRDERQAEETCGD